MTDDPLIARIECHEPYAEAAAKRLDVPDLFGSTS